MLDIKIKIALGLIAIMIFTAPIAIAQVVPAHVVISEVQIATNEFVELYNPTNSAINMTGWHWCYFSPGGNWNKSNRDKTFPEGAIIQAHGFYLIATTLGDFPTADWNLNYKAHFLSNTAGSVGIFPWVPNTKTAEEAKAGKIDAVGWSGVTHVYETATASTPSLGESIERKPLKDGYAPCQDTDDNSVDFDVQDTPTPKNRSSSEMEPAPVELFDADGDLKGCFVKIQDAVDNASDGDTIRVDNGTYEENVDVDEQLTICSEHGAAVTTVSAFDSTDNVIAVTADYVTISGFNVAGATAKGGICLNNANYCNIANNSASNNKIGIHLQMSSQHNTITNNNVLDNENGISLSSSDDNSIYNNYFDNTNNADDDKNNIWNITKIDGPNIIGGSYLGGNYWSDYAGADTDKDGLGDSLLPYNSGGDIQYGGDYHPLVHEGSAPILSILKLDKPDPVQQGGTLNYTIIVENRGNATATNVNVTETYDANVTFASAVPAPSEGNDTWKFDTLNVSETMRINISVTVNHTTSIETVLHNNVNVICDEGVMASNTEDTTVSTASAPPKITSFPPPSPVNDTVGAWRTFNVTVNQMVNVVWKMNGILSQSNGSVKEASFKRIAVEGEHNVTANASNGNGSDSHSWVWNVKQPGISVTKVSSVTEGAPSTNVDFTINVTNTGDCTLNPVKVVDTLPAGMSYVETGTLPAPSIVHGNTITWNIVDLLNPGVSTNISLIAHIDTDAEGTLTNLVNATGKPPAGDNVTGSDTADVTVFEPDIVVISEVFYAESGADNNEFCVLYNPSDSDIDIGDWTLNAFNQDGALITTTTFSDDANINAHKFYLIGEKDPLNSSDWGGTDISPDCLRGGSDWQDGPDDYLVLEDSGGNYIDGVRWGHKDGNNPPPIPDVPDNNTAPDAAAGKSIERKPLSGGYAPCQDTDNNALDFVVQDTPTPKNSSSSETGISVTKVSSVTEGAPSTNVDFTINVTNTGDCTLNPVKVVDTLPAGMSYVETGTLPAPSIVHGNTITWNIVDSLNPGASTNISLIAHIDTDAEGTLTNLVNATGKPPAGDNVTGSDTADVTVFEPDIVVISEVFYAESGADNNEFCELYNPSDSDIDIGDWTLNAFNQAGALITTTTFPDDANINAHKFYLIGEKDPLNSSDWGGTDISPDCLRGGSDWQDGPDDYLVLEDSGGNYIDGVRWGHKDGNNPPPIPDVPDNNTAPDAAAGKSIERKPLSGGYAPCQDTDNNALDFVVQDTPTPKNSSSSETGISVTKVSSVTEGAPSTNVDFTINVTNTGDCTLNPVKVVDTLPAGMSYVETGTLPAPSIVHGNTITWNIVDSLNPGASTNISLIAHIDTDAEGTLTNLVNATGKPPAGDNVTGSDTADVTVFEPDIVVISEVFYAESGADNNEFCELYNPSDSDIDIGDWTLNAFNQAGALITTTTFPDDANINAHKFYLIGEKDPLNSSDWAGTAVSPDYLRGGSDWQDGPDDYLVLEDSGGNYIDGVRWGHKDGNNPPPIPDVPDNNTAPAATAGKSIERKPLGGDYAPCQDTDNNSFDFVVQDTPTPKNSSSLETSISVTKGNVTGAPSTLVNFTITVSNTGDFKLNHVVVKDTLPEGMSYVVETGTSPPPSIVYGNTITWDDVGPLRVNASKTIKLVAKIEEAAEGVLTNMVDVTGTTTGTTVSASDTAQVSVIRVEIEKSCKSSTTSLGKTVEYTIKYSNPNEVDLTNVVITENYPKILTFTSAVPAPDPGTNNKWTIGTLPAEESGKIKIKMKVPASTLDLSYTESGSVSGEGIVMISKELSTKVEPFDLKNIVTISGSYGATNVSATASAITTVSVSGSSLEITEHGSGTYESEEELSVSPENMGIKFDKTTNAEYRPTTFNCSDGFVMEVPSKWSQDICIKNYVKKSAIHKTITEATYMNDNTIIKSDNKGYTMDFDSSFLGYLHVDKKTKDAATSEHYIGKFVIKDWDQGGDETVEGVGYVIVDKELASGRLLLMEHGSGNYSSEEDSSSSRIDKITYAEYEPTSFNFSDSFVVNFSSKWMQDFCTRNKKGTIALHKKIRDATYIDDDTRAKSSPSLKFDTFFYGATHVGSRSTYSRASEDYIGDFYISWAAITDCTFVFEWGEVPGDDNEKLILHLSEPRFGMPWVTDDDVEITKPVKDTIDIFTPEHEHSAEIILDTKTNESAELIVKGVDKPYTFKVEKHGKKLKVFDCVLERKPEEVIGEGFVMVDEAIFSDGGEIQVTEHGSGIYRSYEDSSSKTVEKETYGEYKPTYFNFSDSFSVNFSSLWLQDICAKDEDEGTVIHKKISDAALMKDDTTVTKSLMNITSSFNGSMHIGAKTEKVSISEDYIGEFNVTELIKIVKGKRPKSSSESSEWLFCPCPIPSSTYPWFCQDPTYKGRWLSGCPYPYKDAWLYIHP